MQGRKSLHFKETKLYNISLNPHDAMSARYLGVYLESSTKFKCSFSKNKAGFLKSFNSIFGKIGRSASKEVLFELIKSKCLPILLYGTDVCPTNSAVRHSLQCLQ